MSPIVVISLVGVVLCILGICAIGVVWDLVSAAKRRRDAYENTVKGLIVRVNKLEWEFPKLEVDTKIVRRQLQSVSRGKRG